MDMRAIAAPRALIEHLAQGPLPEWKTMEARIVVRVLRPGEALFQTDVAWPWLAVVASGLMKLVYLREDGRERIKSFIDDGGFFASLAALQQGGRTSFSAVAMEPTQVACLPYPDILTLGERHLAWQKALRRGLEFYGQRKEKRERELLTLNPEERYRLLLREQPALAARVPQKDLALYLGITPVGLSRIRGRVGREPSGGSAA
jgi:CRP-like cAMP-binding protein